VEFRALGERAQNTGGDTVAVIIDYVKAHGRVIFDGISTLIRGTVDGLTTLLRVIRRRCWCSRSRR